MKMLYRILIFFIGKKSVKKLVEKYERKKREAQADLYYHERNEKASRAAYASHREYRQKLLILTYRVNNFTKKLSFFRQLQI